MDLQNTATLLIVDDDAEIRQLLGQFLGKYGYEVVLAQNGNDMLASLSAAAIDLVILDIMMPGEDGFELCRCVRKTSQVPILMLSAVGDETDRIVGLEMGADDYLSKPFNPRELLARIKAILRRTEGQGVAAQGTIKTKLRLPETQYFFDDWQFDMSMRRLISPEGLEIDLTSGEYALLTVFVENPQRILSRDQLLEYAHNRNAGPVDRSIDVQVSRLRQKIEEDPKSPKMIKTVRGGGYLFTAKVKAGAVYGE